METAYSLPKLDSRHPLPTSSGGFDSIDLAGGETASATSLTPQIQARPDDQVERQRAEDHRVEPSRAFDVFTGDQGKDE